MIWGDVNYFLNNSKAVVLASDQKPQMLKGFPERLISRILNGLVTDIEKPDKKIFLEVLKNSNKGFDNTLIQRFTQFVNVVYVFYKRERKRRTVLSYPGSVEGIDVGHTEISKKPIRDKN